MVVILQYKVIHVYHLSPYIVIDAYHLSSYLAALSHRLQLVLTLASVPPDGGTRVPKHVAVMF